MRLEATSAVECEPSTPRLQIITIAEALAGARPRLPKYRPLELFTDVSEPERGETLAGRLADLEGQITEARRDSRRPCG